MKTEGYEGETVEIRQGRGTQKYSNGSVYEGQWKSDKRHGVGVLYDERRGFRYDGEWADDKYEGRGTMVYDQNRQTYEGTFRNGLRHGTGTYTGGSPPVSYSG